MELRLSNCSHFNYLNDFLICSLYILDRVTKVILALFIGWTLIKWTGLNKIFSEVMEDTSASATA